MLLFFRRVLLQDHYYCNVAFFIIWEADGWEYVHKSILLLIELVSFAKFKLELFY